jgi:hypothetical protein
MSMTRFVFPLAAVAVATTPNPLRVQGLSKSLSRRRQTPFHRRFRRHAQAARRRRVRTLFGKTPFFIDKSRGTGVVAELARAPDDDLNERQKFKILGFRVVIIPAQPRRRGRNRADQAGGGRRSRRQYRRRKGLSALLGRPFYHWPLLPTRRTRVPRTRSRARHGLRPIPVRDRACLKIIL